MKWFSRLLVIFTIIASALLTSCSLETSGLGTSSGRRSFIDSPPNETVTAVGIPVAITTHANFYVDRILVSIDLMPADDTSEALLEVPLETVTEGLYQANMTWVPSAAGRYRLIAYSYTGGRINGWDSWTTHTIYINVVETGYVEQEEQVPTPLLTAPAAESEPAPWIDLWADQYSLITGSCTTLYWDSQHVNQLLLDGEAVAFNGSRRICPTSTQMYSIKGSNTAGSTEKSVTINVSAQPSPEEEPPSSEPADISGPDLSKFSLSESKVFDNSTCGADSNMITIQAEDLSGISRVELNYRVKTSKADGAWQIINMSAAGHDKYTATLGSTQLSSSLAEYAPGTVEVLIKAWDNKNNQSQTGINLFSTDYCIY